MNKTLLNTRFGTYAFYFANGEPVPIQVYRGKNSSCPMIGCAILGSLSEVPDKGVSYENGEYVVPSNHPVAQGICQQAKRNDFKQIFNYTVIRDFDGNLRILPQTHSVEDSLTTRVRIAAQQIPARKP